jgi:hypothetical protein
MAKKGWAVSVDNKEHIVEINLRVLTGEGEVIVDGKIVKAWAGRAGRKRGPTSVEERSLMEFEVAGKLAILRRKAIGGYDLFVDGQLIPDK